MSIENKLTYLESTKGAIKQAIIGKGVSVTESDTFRSYAEKIGQIQGGGSGDCPKYSTDLSDGVSDKFLISYEIKNITLPSNMDNVIKMNDCFNNFLQLTSIELPELPSLTNIDRCFQYCSSITSITFPSSLPKVTNMQACFFSCNSLTSIELPELPLLANMSGCFYSCTSLTSVTLPSSLPNVTAMNSCFSNCIKLTSIELPELPLLVNMSYCFQICTSLTSITLPSSLPKVTNMSGCFSTCQRLTSIELPELPSIRNMRCCFKLSGFITIRLKSLSTVTDSYEMFTYDYDLENIYIESIGDKMPLTNWGISTCTRLTVESLVNIMNALPTITSTKTCTIGTTNLAKLSPEQLAIGTSKGWSIN